MVLSQEQPAANDTLQLIVQVGKLVERMGKDTPEVRLAVAEMGLNSAVSRGENAGKNLHHESVLQTFRRLGVADASKESLSFTGKPTVKFKSTWKRDNLSVVVFM